MKFRDGVLQRYLVRAPAALAVERAEEARLFSGKTFERPVLDVGCGDGIFAHVVFAEPIDTGVDIDRREIDKARRWNAYRELIVCPGNAIPKPDQSFRTIFSNSVLEHIPDLGAVLREIRRVLQPGGRFYATIPATEFEAFSVGTLILRSLRREEAARRYAKAYNRFWRHYNVHDEAGWRDLFARAGFDVVNITRYAPGPLCTMNDVLVPFGLPAHISNKLLGRWIAIPSLRRIYAGLIHAALKPLVARFSNRPGGGLVFFELTVSAVLPDIASGNPTP